jgi:ferrochelatase
MSIFGAATASASLVDSEVHSYDAILLVSYGGPEGPADVLPFLENATRGRAVPRERLLGVAKHYEHFGGVSPLNAQNRALAASLEAELTARGRPLPVYLGNRNWHPFLEATIRQMRDDGVQRTLSVVTSAFSSYSSCRQYREDVIGALGDTEIAVDKVRAFYDHPLFVEANALNLRAALAQVIPDRRDAVRVVFTAHSIPRSMADHCDYQRQLEECARLVSRVAGIALWDVAYQSRSGPPHVPWLGPDIVDHLKTAAAEGVRDVVVLPLGFISDHMEVLYDLDIEAQAAAATLDVRLVRAATVGVSTPFVRMLAELVEERCVPGATRRSIGQFGPSHDICPRDCCQR